MLKNVHSEIIKPFSTGAYMSVIFLCLSLVHFRLLSYKTIYLHFLYKQQIIQLAVGKENYKYINNSVIFFNNKVIKKTKLARYS